jgi:hypothetical protein
MNCRHRPTAFSTLICGLVLGNWPQSVLGMDRFRIADQPEVTERAHTGAPQSGDCHQFPHLELDGCTRFAHGAIRPISPRRSRR